MANELKKAPLGTIPWCIAVDGRIKDLAGAIDRYSEYNGNSKYLSIRRWAKEIILQCELADSMATDPAGRYLMDANGNITKLGDK